MITKRPGPERGHLNFGWLDTYHTFSFGDYYDPKHMGFSDLRVINEDRIAPGMGFGTHPHKDMEILTYVISGAVKHKDSMGNETTIPAGKLQIMSAGTGIRHSEFNASQDEELHLYQIWMLPKETGLSPRYDELDISTLKRNKWIQIGSPDPMQNGLQIMQDINLYLLKANVSQKLEIPSKANRKGWLQVVKGLAQVGNITLKPGDGVALSNEEGLILESSADSDVLFFDLV